jgi:hypothetical protein
MRYSHLNLSLELQRLRLLAIYKRWVAVAVCWSILAPLGVWELRAEIELWRDYFTWTAVRYGLAYHPLAALCLLFCFGITLSTLVLHCEYRWGAISPREKTRLEQHLGAIAQLSPRHPLRRWVFQDRN